MNEWLRPIEGMDFRKKMLLITLLPLVGALAIVIQAVVFGSSLPIVGIAVLLLCLLLAFQIGNAEAKAMRAVETSAQSIASGQDYRQIQGYGKNTPIGKTITQIRENATNDHQRNRAAIKQGIQEIVVNLARRNQTLVDRQVEVLDALESSEENPDTLEQLFVVDHLATRMRRNSESLLVLADAEAPKRRGAPVLVSDVLRVAAGEVENYQNLSVTTEKDSYVSANAAVDLAHLLAELIENATNFSPPNKSVEVTGKFTIDDDYVINVIDHGTGMSANQLELSNDILENPPELDLGLSRSLGFRVIGRLAQRLGMKATLHTTPGSGVSAVVRIPKYLLVDADGNSNAPAEAGAGLTAPAPAPRSDNQDPTDRAAIKSDTTATLSALKSLEGGTLAGSSDRKDTAAKKAKVAKGGEKLSARRGKSKEDEAISKPANTKPAAKESQPTKQAPKGKAKPTKQAPKTAPKSAKPTETVEAPAKRPEKLADAVPSGEAFEKGLDDLRAPEGEEPVKLTKRKRGNSAPTSEGRAIPEGKTAAKASGRKPEEIRLMLSRYRDGIKGSEDETNGGS